MSACGAYCPIRSPGWARRSSSPAGCTCCGGNGCTWNRNTRSHGWSVGEAALQGGGDGRVAVHQVLPTHFPALAPALLDQLQAVRVDGEGVGTVVNGDLAAYRLVELRRHGGPP